MLSLSELKGQWGLVTGASSGIGYTFCSHLAQAGMNLVLVARRQPLLETLAQDLSQRYQTQNLVEAVDLSKENVVAGLKGRLNTKGIRIRLLCNNAAFGRWGRFEATTADVYDEMIRLNDVALVSMCNHFLSDLNSFPTSVIINVSSPAALQPIPYMAVYAATKAFVHSFSQALYGEWKSKGILVQTLVPGPTSTEFDKKAGAYVSALKERDLTEKVVEASLKHLSKDLPVVTTAKGTYTQRFFAGLFPAKIVIREVAKMFQPPK